MDKAHRLQERRQAILSALEESGELSVAGLCTRFNTSEVTIRSDLQALNNQGLLYRTRGGALAVNSPHELAFHVRQQQQASVKDRIGNRAAALVAAGDTIALDASTTALAMLPYLKKLSSLTVVTNSLKVTVGLLNAPHISVIMPGGTLRRESVDLISQQPMASLQGVSITATFIGASGLTLTEGLMEVSQEEVRVKQALIACSQRTIAVLDGRKWGQSANHPLIALNRLHTIVTDRLAPKDLINAVQHAGVLVIQV